MRVLLAHEFYRSSAPSGEDAVFENEKALLADNNFEVIAYEKHNDDIDESGFIKKIKLARECVWSDRTYAEVSDLIRTRRPAVAHFHNTFPLMSVSAYAACKDNQVPVVQTLHNYRLICPNGLLLRDGVPCEKCVGRMPVSAVRYACYRQSRLATTAVSWMIFWNRLLGRYDKLVDRYIALTDFAAAKLSSGGLPRKKITIKPNFIEAASQRDGLREDYAVFVGRLGEEKGIKTLIEGWRTRPAGFELVVIGDGPLRAELEADVKASGAPVRFLGFQPRATVLDWVGRAAFQIIPSECYEGFPIVILEAFSSGTPVLASAIGSLDEIVDDGQTGIKFEPANVDDLLVKVDQLVGDEALREQLGRNAGVEFESKFTPQAAVESLRSIYSSVIRESKTSLARR